MGPAPGSTRANSRPGSILKLGVGIELRLSIALLLRASGGLLSFMNEAIL